MNLTLRYAAHSHRGLVRDGNQDAVYAGPRLLAVADGMGGMAAGDVASRIVIDAMAPLDEDVPGDAMVDALRGSVETANQHLRATVEANPQMEGMGTTLTALLFSGSRAGLVHIGDSRAYLLRDGVFSQITKDDTYVQMLVDEGRISSEEAGSHPQRSLLTRAMDGRDLDPEYSVREVLAGDRYLICSDGLSGVVSEDTIGGTLKEHADPQACVDRLINLALRGGGPDNITVIVADTTDEDIVEGTPLIGGAATKPAGTEELPGSDEPTESTPAARASALSPPVTPTDPLVVNPPTVPPYAGAAGPVRARRLPSVLLLVLLLVVLGAGLWAGWWYTQTSYHVGITDEGEVAVFRGVPAHVAGFSLSRPYESSGFLANQLEPEAQRVLERGTAQVGSPDEAEAEMHRLICDHLRNPLRPPDFCPAPPPDPAPPPAQTTPPAVPGQEEARPAPTQTPPAGD